MRQSHVGGAGNDPLLARRQGHIGIGRRQHIIHDQKVLAAAADGKRIDRRDPRLLGGRARDFVGRTIGPREPAQHFVFEAENMLDVEEIGNLAAIEPRQVDPGGKHAGVFRMVDRAAAQHRDRRCRVENGEIDRRLDGVEGRVVERVEETRMVHLDQRGAAEARHRRGAAIERAAGGKLGEALARILPRQQHGMAQMAPARGMREDMGEQDALVDLEAVLALQRVRRLLPDLRGGRRQPGDRGRGLVDEVLGAHEAAATAGELAIEGLDMAGEEILAGLARLAQDQVAGCRLAGVTGKLCRQACAQRRRLLPVERERRTIRTKIAADAGPRIEKRGSCSRREAGTREHAASSPSAACARALIGFLCTPATAQEKSYCDQAADMRKGRCGLALTTAAGRSMCLPCRSSRRSRRARIFRSCSWSRCRRAAHPGRW